jgi:6-phosphogluconolactonase
MCRSHIHWFRRDDRFVPYNDPRSKFGIAPRLLLDRVPPANICARYLKRQNVEEAARLYKTELRRSTKRLLPGRPLFDMALIALGTDGHTASLSRVMRSSNRWPWLCAAIHIVLP